MKKLPIEREKSYQHLGIAVAKQVFTEFKIAYTRYLKTGNIAYKMTYGQTFSSDINTLIRYILSEEFEFFIGDGVNPKTTLIMICKDIERETKCKKGAKMLSAILTEDLS